MVDILRDLGTGYCRWTERRGSGKNRHTVKFKGQEQLFQFTSWLFSNGSNKMKHPVGTSNYPFVFTLPTTLPSSFESKIGHIRYALTGKIILNPFIHNVVKWPNILWKSSCVHTARFLKYVWPFYSIMHERVNITFVKYCFMRKITITLLILYCSWQHFTKFRTWNCMFHLLCWFVGCTLCSANYFLEKFCKIHKRMGILQFMTAQFYLKWDFVTGFLLWILWIFSKEILAEHLKRLLLSRL